MSKSSREYMRLYMRGYRKGLRRPPPWANKPLPDLNGREAEVEAIKHSLRSAERLRIIGVRK